MPNAAALLCGSDAILPRGTFAKTCWGMIPCRSANGKDALGPLSVKRTTSGPISSTPIWRQNSVPAWRCSGVCKSRYVNTTSSAVNGLPSAHRTPVRRFTVYVSPSEDTDQLRARSGAAFWFASTVVSPS